MFLISASTPRSASRLAERRGIPQDKYIYLPWGNSYEREKILEPFKFKAFVNKEFVNKQHMLGYFTDREIADLTGSF